MFDNNFYPTPKHVARKMISPYRPSDLGEMSICDPEAGKGDILDVIKEVISSHYYSGFEFKPYCIEKNKELQFILAQKGYRLIAEDFLKYDGDYYFDLIVMNPPFSEGDKHFLKAWEIMKEGDICCLLNAETIRNPHTETRKLVLKIIEDNNGTVEELGRCFMGSERTTDVEVVMIRVNKKAKEKFLEFDFEDVTDGKEIKLDENTLQNPIATRDIIGNMILQFDKLKDSFIEYMKAREAMGYYSSGLLTRYAKFEEIIHPKGKDKKQRYNTFVDSMKMEIWKVVIEEMGMDRYMTKQVRDNFAKFIQAQGSMDFTKENVQSLIRTLLLNKETILENAVVDVFDIFTKYHEDNRCYVEGWKTNDKFKVNKRVILPRFIEMGWSGKYKNNSSYWNEYSDIERVMCYICGYRYEDLTNPIGSYEYGVQEEDKEYKRLSLKHAVARVRIGDSSKQESEFFYFRCYKKGTLHIEFKDKWLYEEFNMRACDGKKWLPETEKKAWEEKKEKEQQFRLSA